MPKTAQHTPGPWMLDDPCDKHPQRGSGGERIHKVVGTGFGAGLIADVSAWWTDTETARANARLIAAAPEMLDLLRDLHAARGPLELKDLLERNIAFLAKMDGAQ